MSQAASSATSIANGGNISDVGGGGSNGGAGVSIWVIVGVAGGAVVLGLVVWLAVKKGK